jgi:hypothetical protein
MTVKRTLRIVCGWAWLILGAAAQSNAQNLIQPLTVNLVVYDTVGGRIINIGTPQFIRYLMGTNVPNGNLYLVTPSGNSPGQTGALGAFLRITSGSTTIYRIPSVAQFNLYQDVSVLTPSGNMIYAFAAINRFSFDTGAVRAELQGISTWTFWTSKVNGVPLSGAGRFTSHVNGWMNIYNVTHSDAPVSGTIFAGRPTVGN